MGQPLKKAVTVNKSNPYDGYETQTTTNAKSKEINTPIEQFRKHVHEAMEQGLEKFGVKVENQPIIKINEKTNKKVVTLFSGFLFIEDGYHETRKAIYEFSIPQLYFKGIGENIIKRVVDEKSGTIKETISQGQTD
tara:strand:+ start:218 stop:625 length:408 start_codon:yes stop_codon:yes gene_type:complete